MVVRAKWLTLIMQLIRKKAFNKKYEVLKDIQMQTENRKTLNITKSSATLILSLTPNLLLPDVSADVARCN